MLRLLLLMCLAVPIHAAPCASALLSTYIAGGCSNQGVTFDGWAYTPGGSSIGAGDILVFAGGIIPERDIAGLKGAGVDEIFLPGTPTGDIVAYLNRRLSAA